MEEPDKLILASLREGSRSAFDALYMEYAPYVEAFAFCLLKNKAAAEDITQDIFLKMWLNRESLGHVRSVKSYLFIMTRNAVFDIFEHRSVRLKHHKNILRTGDIFSDDVFDKVSSEDLLMIINVAVEQMPAQRQKVFRMSRYEGMSHQDIAEQLNISTKTVEYHIRAALAELRKIVGTILVFFI